MDSTHSHVFLAAGHATSERRTWAVIWLCAAMMLGEIVGGWLFGSIALVADGMHMGTHAGAMLLAGMAYSYARRHLDNPLFSFGTGKFGDLAGYTSAVVLAMIALLIAWESASRLLWPEPIRFAQALPIAALGLVVNLVSAWMLGAAEHHHHDDDDHHHDDDDDDHASAGTHHDHNIRAAALHVLADAAVSVLVIAGLLLAWTFGWVFMDPLAGLVGAGVIASWSWGLMRDTGAILLDANPDRRLAARMRALVEAEGDEVTDLHLWRLGPGHLGAIVAVRTDSGRGPAAYRDWFARFAVLSHVTIEVQRRGGS